MREHVRAGFILMIAGCEMTDIDLVEQYGLSNDVAYEIYQDAVNLNVYRRMKRFAIIRDEGYRLYGELMDAEL